MYNTEFKNRLVTDLEGLKAAGLYKQERYIDTPQYSEVGLRDGSKVINMCANNYLGLANHPELEKAAKEAIDRWGFGMASVRFICGTQTLHDQLEERLSAFLGTEATILFGSCFDANGGLFGALLDKEDAIISDSLNHASIIDGVRLCKAARYRYANNDMADLEAKLQEAKANGARTIMISTDGVFSMDGIIASLDKIHALAEKYGALVHFDESHSTGVLGKRGRGTHEHCGLFGKIDITSGTFGKALGGASGGYVSVSTMRSHRSLQVRFADNGPGMQDEARHRLFQPFSHTAQPGKPGIGLGLALSRDIARSIGGELSLEKSTSRGTTFILTLPLGE